MYKYMFIYSREIIPTHACVLLLVYSQRKEKKIFPNSGYHKHLKDLFKFHYL